MTQNNKQLIVNKIENGTVIDHIAADKVFQIVKLLGLDKGEDEVLIGTNLSSKKLGRKGIIKLTNRYFEKNELDKMALISPDATVITIKNFEVVDKKSLHIPHQIDNICKCINPNCITNIEEVATQFDVVGEEPLTIKCHYCEKVMNEIKFKE